MYTEGSLEEDTVNRSDTNGKRKSRGQPAN